ncbi:MAG: hypothetical protein JWO38_5236 [Gemmataceae bacterium]|nr:hypothetical protein [Gemmataceae bacterium]
MVSVTRFLCVPLCLLCVFVVSASANPPIASYVYPAGGQRGTTVPVRVGGLFLHEKCRFALDGKGLAASPVLTRTKPIWFEGPVLPLPDSQQAEDYPADMAGSVAIAKDAAPDPRRGWVFTSQGGAGGLVFVVGDLPEVIEKEVDGDSIPERITLPVTANGRIFPRDNLDLWEFDADAGQTVTASLVAKSLNSPLAPRLEILDTAGHVLAENMIHPVTGADESVRLTAPAKGKYRVRVGDARGQGGQAHIYRLTVTAAAVPDFAFPLKVAPDGLTDVVAKADVVPAPAALNGKLVKPGAADEWRVGLKKGGRYTLDLQARRADSPLCGVVTVLDATGKELARAEAADPSADPTLAFQPPADGVYTVRVAERFRGRGGPNFAYRLRVTDGTGTSPPGFRLSVQFDTRQGQTDAVTVLRGGTVKVKVNVDRMGGFAGPVEVSAADLPKGVAAKPVTIAANQTAGELTIQADATAAVTTVPLAITGTAAVGPVLLSVTGAAAVEVKTLRVPAVVPGTRFLPDTRVLHLAVGVPTPFKIVDEYVMTSAPRGEVYRRKYRVERETGFDGPIEVRLADRQARHLQGVTGPVLVVPAAATDVEYPATLPPWMELGRTCRVCVMAVGKVKDADGTEHTVSFSSTGQNQQMIVVVGPGRLDLSLDRLTVRAEPGGEVRVSLKVARARDLTGPVKVEVLIPEHWKGVSADVVTVPADTQAGELVVRFAAGEAGPFNMPLTVRATLATPASAVTAEAKLEVVGR